MGSSGKRTLVFTDQKLISNVSQLHTRSWAWPCTRTPELGVRLVRDSLHHPHPQQILSASSDLLVSRLEGQGNLCYSQDWMRSPVLLWNPLETDSILQRMGCFSISKVVLLPQLLETCWALSFLVQLVLHLTVAPDMREVRWVLKTSLIPQAHPFLGLASPSDRRGCHALCSTSLTSCLSLPISESLSWYGLIWDFIKYKKEQRLCWLYNKSSATLGWARGDELLSWTWKVKLLLMLPADWCQDSIYKMLKIHMMH